MTGGCPATMRETPIHEFYTFCSHHKCLHYATRVKPTNRMCRKYTESQRLTSPQMGKETSLQSVWCASPIARTQQCCLVGISACVQSVPRHCCDARALAQCAACLYQAFCKFRYSRALGARVNGLRLLRDAASGKFSDTLWKVPCRKDQLYNTRRVK